MKVIIKKARNLSVLNKVIVSTRPVSDNDEFEKILKNSGVVVHNFPMIQIKPVHDDRINGIIKKLDEYFALFFTSSNSAKIFLDLLKDNNKVFKGKIFSIGEKTSDVIRSYGYDVYFTPSGYNADELLNTIDKNELADKKVLLPVGSLSMRTLRNGLKNITDTDEIIIYETIAPVFDEKYEPLKEMLYNGEINCVSFFSPSAIDNYQRFTKNFEQKNIDFAVIGRTTLNRAETYNLKIKIMPERSTAAELAKAIIYYYNH